jgi:hypothetical protein
MEDTDSTQQEPQVLAATMALPRPVADAAQRGDLQAVKAWLAKPLSDIDSMDVYEWTLLHHVCLADLFTADHVALAEYLLSRGASVNTGDASVLHCAVVRHHSSHPTDMVGLLLRAGADVDARDDRGESPIAWAIANFRDFDANSTERELTRALECTVQLLRYGASLADGFYHPERWEGSCSLEDFLEFQTTRSPGITSTKQWIDCQAILAGVQTAGSWRAFRDDRNNPWRAYERVPRKAVLRLRSLVARKRATTANPLFNALFASPNEIVWHVLSFWRARIPSS